jgi:group I intron endonuclease
LNINLYKGAPLQKKAERIGARTFSTSNSVSKNSSSTRCNTFLIDLDRKAKDKYDSLPAKSILKHPDSFVSQRIVYLESEVLALYKLSSECKKDIQEFFTTQVKLDIPGIYCFMSKNISILSYYIGSSVNMKRRYNRHQNNLNSKEDRNSQANPKFYNYVRKYGWESLEFGCLLETKDYLVMFSGFDLSPEEISLLKILTQLDLLITEQYFLDSYGLSLNISPVVGTRESAILSAETRKKMSDSHLGKLSTISEEKRAVIKAKAKEAWANEPSNSERREAVSAQHGRAVVILDPDKNVIEEFVSQIKAAEHLGVERRIISRRIASEALFDSKIGPVYSIKQRIQQSQEQ